MEKELEETKEVLRQDVENYARSQAEVLRLKAVAVVGNVIGSVLLALCLILITFAVLACLALAAVFALSQCVPTWAACLIVGGIYLLLIPVVIYLSKVIFVNVVIKKMSGLRTMEDLKYETLRAEGQAAVQQERIDGHLRSARQAIMQYTRMAGKVWSILRKLFGK